MQTYADFRKSATPTSAGEYFQRREEQLAKDEMAGFRDGTNEEYPGSWTKLPGSDFWALNTAKVPDGYVDTFWEKMDDINKKYNGNLYRAYQQRENDPNGSGVATKSMGFRMLPTQSFMKQMYKDWDKQLDTIRNSKITDNPEPTGTYMERRWGSEWMTNPKPQFDTVSEGQRSMIKQQSYLEFCKTFQV